MQAKDKDREQRLRTAGEQLVQWLADHGKFIRTSVGGYYYLYSDTQSDRPVHIPPIWLCTDNAAMVAGAGYFRYIAGQRDALDMDVLPNWSVSEI